MSLIAKPPLGIKLNCGHPLARGLVGCWPMNEGSGNRVNDLSGNGATGILYNATTWSGGIHGLVTNYTLGSSSYGMISPIPAIIDNLVDKFSLGCWCRVSATTTFSAILGKGNPGTDGWALQFRNNASPFRIALALKNASTANYDAECSFPANEWHFVMASYDGAVGKIYLDGNYVASGVLAGPLVNSTYNFYFGADQSRSRYNTLDLCISYVYDRCLSASEIAALYRNPFGMFRRDVIDL